MANPIGVTEHGGVVFTASPNAMRALELFAQLETWRAKGYDPQLWGGPDGWTLILDSEKWGGAAINERSRKQLIRFCTAPYGSPEAVIEAALQVIQP